MSTKLEILETSLREVLGEKIQSLNIALGEVTLVIKSDDYLSAMQTLRDHVDLRFEQLMDLCGMDYSTYGDGAWDGARFAGLVAVPDHGQIDAPVCCHNAAVAALVVAWDGLALPKPHRAARTPGSRKSGAGGEDAVSLWTPPLGPVGGGCEEAVCEAQREECRGGKAQGGHKREEWKRQN